MRSRGGRDPITRLGQRRQQIVVGLSDEGPSTLPGTAGGLPSGVANKLGLFCRRTEGTAWAAQGGIWGWGVSRGEQEAGAASLADALETQTARVCR